MKKYFIAVAAALIFGGGFAFCIFSSSTKSDELAFENTGEKVYIFQMGVYSSEENANNYASTLESSLIKKIGELYYVYGAVYSEINLISILKTHYDNKKIDYAIKEIIVDDEFYRELISYEKLLMESADIKVITRANQIILDKYNLVK